jgi:hypothetical protein
MTPPADRARLEAQQAELLRALLRGDDFPRDFDADDAAAAGQALRRKRARMVSHAWPAVAHELADFAARFDAFARTTPPPPAGFGYTDGLAFARTLPRDELSDSVRVELLLARASIAGPPSTPRRRRSPFLGAVVLHEPLRLLIVHRTPGFGRRTFVIRLGRGR